MSAPTASSPLTIFLPGMGAVASTFVAGVLLARKQAASPFGSFVEYGRLPAPEGREDRKAVPFREHADLPELGEMHFAGWDIFPDNLYESALHAGVLSAKHLDRIRDELAAIEPMKGVFFPEYVKRLQGTHLKGGKNKAELVSELRQDIRATMKRQGTERGVAVWCGSTEIYLQASEVHQSIAAFEEGLKKNHPQISNSMLYAWACLKEGVPFANGAPNLCTDLPAMEQLAEQEGVPICGKDFKTGQTLMKTLLAPGLKARHLGVRGWFSTNILGNRDGEVLDEAENFKTKEMSKLGVLDSIFEPEDNQELYGDIYHKVRINYYPPRGDEKEGWDNIDIFGWLGYSMQIKVDFLCRDSILAAPLVHDLALLLDLAARAGKSGTQKWLGFYFKHPTCPQGDAVLHDLFHQERELHRALQGMARDSSAAELKIPAE